MAKKKALKKQAPSAKQVAKSKASRKTVSKRALAKVAKEVKATGKKTAIRKAVAKKAPAARMKAAAKTSSVSKPDAVAKASAPAKPAKKTPTAKVPVKPAPKPAAKVASKSATANTAVAPKPASAPAAKAAPKGSPVAAKPAAVPAAAKSATASAPMKPATAPVMVAGGHRVIPVHPKVNHSSAVTIKGGKSPVPVTGRPLLFKPKSQPSSGSVQASPPPSAALLPRAGVSASPFSGQPARVFIRPNRPTGPAAPAAAKPVTGGPGQRPALQGKARRAVPQGFVVPSKNDSVVVFKRKAGSKLQPEVLRRVLRELEYVTVRHTHPQRAGAPKSAHAARGALDALVRIPAPAKPRQFAPVAEQMDILMKGVVEAYSGDELRAKLEQSRKTGRPLRVKLGLDPSRPDIHVGHCVVLRKLRQFQDLGHQPVVIIGDYTAMVGDPSGKSKTRPTLSEAEVAEAARTYFDQISSVLDTSTLEVRRNGEWFGRMGFSRVMKLAGQVTVARVLEREDFSKRYREQAPISLHEFFYPLMQGHDSVEVRADVELGGTDQTFNLLMGRKLQEDEGMAPQVCLTTPLIPGLDGVEKMSKSLGNAIGVRESPDDMFGKTMSIPDALMKSWFENITGLPAGEIAKLCDPARTSPREAKDRLAQEVVAMFHGRNAAAAASAEFLKRFRDKELPADMPVHSRSRPNMTLETLLLETRLAYSTSEVRRLMGQNGFRVIPPGGSIADAAIKTDPKEVCNLPSGTILMAGKRRFVRLA